MEIIEIIAALILCIPVGTTISKYDNERKMTKLFLSWILFPACVMILWASKRPNNCAPCEKESKYKLIQEPVYRKIK